MKVKNKYTNKIYEAIQYSHENFQKCKEFIHENKDVSVTQIIPKMRVYGLMSYQSITDINPTDYIIRTLTSGIPLYKIVPQNIIENNFEIMEY